MIELQPVDDADMTIPIPLLTESELESELVDVEIVTEDKPLYVPLWPALPAALAPLSLV